MTHLQTVTAQKLRHQQPLALFWESIDAVSRRKTSIIAGFAAAAILVHLILRFALQMSPGVYQIPLLATLALGGIPLVYELLKNLLRREFGSDLLAGISIVTSVVLGEYLAGSIVVLPFQSPSSALFRCRPDAPSSSRTPQCSNKLPAAAPQFSTKPEH